MSTKKSDRPGDVFIECPYCKVCSIKLSAEEHLAVELGQRMLEVCPICGKELYINDD